MRAELLKIERIEKFLLKELSEVEMENFTDELNSSEALRDAVNEQRLVMDAFIRFGLIGLTKSARKKYVRNKWLKWGGISLGILALGIFLTMAYMSAQKEKECLYKENTTDNTETIHGDEVGASPSDCNGNEKVLHHNETDTTGMSELEEDDMIIDEDLHGVDSIVNNINSEEPSNENPTFSWSINSDSTQGHQE